MVFDRKDFTRLRNAVFLASLLAWSLLLTERGRACCCTVSATGLSWKTVLESNPPTALLQGWALMLLAMMAPTLVLPMYFIRQTSFAQRRVRSISLFVIGYGAVWMSAGAFFIAVELASKRLSSISYWPAIVVGLGATVWQMSPFKQFCLNRCHSHRPLAVLGFAADWGATRMGLEHGIWCVGSCWANMLFPILLPKGHYAAMGAVTVLMFCERLDPGEMPTWRLHGFKTAVLYIKRWLQVRRISESDQYPWRGHYS